MWGWDRKIRYEDRRLASGGLSSDDKLWLGGADLEWCQTVILKTDFSIPLLCSSWIFIFSWPIVKDVIDIWCLFVFVDTLRAIQKVLSGQLPLFLGLISTK